VRIALDERAAFGAGAPERGERQRARIERDDREPEAAERPRETSTAARDVQDPRGTARRVERSPHELHLHRQQVATHGRGGIPIPVVPLRAVALVPIPDRRFSHQARASPPVRPEGARRGGLRLRSGLGARVPACGAAALDRHPIPGTPGSAVSMIGETLSHYRILTEIGSGGMGVVYEEYARLSP
jgi:hypothetical protein